MAIEKPALVTMRFLDGRGDLAIAVGRLVREGDFYFAVATDHHMSIPANEKHLLEEDGLEEQPSPSPDYRAFLYRRNILT